MRYLSTSDADVDRLKKLAKKLQRSKAGKHADLLNRVARQAGYDHWHHVVQCNQAAKATLDLRTIRSECEAIIASELRGQAKAVMTGPELAVGPFVLFASGIGDAWLLEPDEGLASCLVWQGGPQPIDIRDDPARLEIAWDCEFELMGDFFRVESTHPLFGSRAIGGYPLEGVRKLIDRAQSFEAKFNAVIAQTDALEMTPEVMVQMGKKGWSEAELLAMKAEGYRYLPSRNTLVSPIVSNDDEELD